MKAGVPTSCYDLDGESSNEAYNLIRNGKLWQVFYFERGQKVNTMSLTSESDACLYMLKTILSDEIVMELSCRSDILRKELQKARSALAGYVVAIWTGVEDNPKLQHLSNGEGYYIPVFANDDYFRVQTRDSAYGSHGVLLSEESVRALRLSGERVLVIPDANGLSQIS